ncbi:MAG: MFS transporter [Pirellulales bacterium]|nr:MFS transporter [Pirellulales bacterium]|tara:strand:+ start:604 stop:1806 length:1203 start_codon:yes stop_codon:yes gene_type:complete
MTPSTSNQERLYTPAFAVMFLGQIGFVMSNAVIAHYGRFIKHLGGSVDTVGQITAGGMVASLVLRPWIGQLINFLGTKNTLAIGYVVFASGTAGNLLIDDLHWTIYLFRGGLALGAAFVFSSMLTYATLIAPDSRRAEAIGSLGVAGFIGLMVGPALWDLVLGTGPYTDGVFDRMFMTVMGCLALPALLILILPVPEREERSGPSGLLTFFAIARKNWPGTVIAVNAGFGMCMTIPLTFFTRWIDDKGIQLEGVSFVTLFFLIYAGWGMSLRILTRQLPDRIGRRKVLLAGVVSMFFGMLTYTLVTADNPYLIVIPAFLCGSGHALIYHSMTSIILSEFAPSERGSGTALATMTFDGGHILMSWILGIIAKQVSYDAMFLTVAGVLAAVSVLYFGRNGIR